MALLDFLRGKKRQEPLREILDPVLGKLAWSDDGNGWFGLSEGLEYSLAYERAETPTPEVLCFARERVTNSEWRTRVERLAKSKARIDLPPRFHHEIEGLSLKTVAFYRHRKLPNGVMVLAQFSGGATDHFWSADYRNDEITGVGFDT